MKSATSSTLRSHLADFETTTSHLLRSREARALLNFSALFHEEVFLTDTALGDHQLIIDSFKADPYSGLYSQILGLAKAGILKFLFRNKVVIADKQEFGEKPTLQEIYRGWQERDRRLWGGEQGFTSSSDEQSRNTYYKEIQDFIERNEKIVQPYDPDKPKSAFRHKVREQLDTPGMLIRSVLQLPPELQRRYFAATKDPWFTNAELWRVLRLAPPEIAGESIILHAHINQLCFAEITGAGPSEHDRSRDSLASFNLELQRIRPHATEIKATVSAPTNLQELFEQAPLQLRSPGVLMFDQLSIEKIVELRRHATALFSLASQPVDRENLASFKQRYVKTVAEYWNHIVDSFELMYPDKMRQPSNVALFVEQQLSTLGPLYRKFGRSIFVMLLRLKLSPVLQPLSPIITPVVNAVHESLNFLFVQRTPENLELRAEMPPSGWDDWYPRGILGLDGMPQKKKDT